MLWGNKPLARISTAFHNIFCGQIDNVKITSLFKVMSEETNPLLASLVFCGLGTRSIDNIFNIYEIHANLFVWHKSNKFSEIHT